MNERKSFNENNYSLKMPLTKEEDLKKEIMDEKRRKLPIIILFFVSMFFSLFVGTSFYRLFNGDTFSSRAEEEQVLGEVVEDKEENIQNKMINKVAYVNENSISVYNYLTKETINIDGEDGVERTALAWRNTNELTFSECRFENCEIKTFNILENKFVDSFKVNGESIKAVRWSHNGNGIAYLFEEDGFLFLTLKSESVFKNIGKFAFDKYKPLEIEDDIYLRFSPNDESILLVNTFAPVDEPSIFILNIEGGKVFDLKKSYGNTPNSAFFMSNDLIYYKSEKKLYVRSFSEKEGKVLTERIIGAYEVNPSPDRSKIAYWTYDWISGVSTLWIYEIGGNELKRVRDQQSKPVWISNEVIVSSYTPDCKYCTVNMFQRERLDQLDLDTKVVSSLVENSSVSYYITDNI